MTSRVSQVLAILIRADAQQAVREIEGVGRTAERSLSRVEGTAQRSADQFLKVGAALTGVAAVGAVGLSKTVQSAAQLEQAGAAVASVFGENADIIEEFAATSARSIGASEASAKQLAVTVGGLLKQLGFAGEEVALLSTRLEVLSADLGATFGTSTETAILAIAAALRGERDPIEKFAVSVKQVDINARLAERGLEGLTGAQRRNAEAAAALELIFEQTTDVQDQFERLQGTTAVETQKLAAEFENLKAKLGSAVNEAVGPAIGQMNALLEIINGFPPQVLAAAGAAAAVGTALAGISGIALLTAGGMKKLAEATSISATRLRQLRGAAAIGGTALTGLIVVLGELQRAQSDLNAGASNVAQDFLAGFDTIPEKLAAAEEALASFQAKADSSFGFANVPIFGDIGTPENVAAQKLVEEFQTEIDFLTALMGENAAAARLSGRGIDQFGNAADGAAVDVEKLAEAIEGLFAPRRARIDFEQSLIGLQQAEIGLAEAEEQLQDSLLEEAGAAGRASSAMRGLASSQRAVAGASRDLARAQADLAEFFSPRNDRIRELERGLILDEEIGTSREARQKELDLLRFDERVADELEGLNRSVEDSANRLTEATISAAEAQQDLAEESANMNRQVTEDFLAVRSAELEVEGAALDVIEAWVQLGDEADEQTQRVLDQIGRIVAGLDPESPLAQALEGIRLSFEAIAEESSTVSRVWDDIIKKLPQILGPVGEFLFGAQPAAARVGPNGTVGETLLDAPLPDGSGSTGASIIQNNTFSISEMSPEAQADLADRAIGSALIQTGAG